MHNRTICWQGININNCFCSFLQCFLKSSCTDDVYSCKSTLRKSKARTELIVRLYRRICHWYDTNKLVHFKSYFCRNETFSSSWNAERWCGVIGNSYQNRLFKREKSTFCGIDLFSGISLYLYIPIFLSRFKLFKYASNDYLFLWKGKPINDLKFETLFRPKYSAFTAVYSWDWIEWKKEIFIIFLKSMEMKNCCCMF